MDDPGRTYPTEPTFHGVLRGRAPWPERGGGEKIVGRRLGGSGNRRLSGSERGTPVESRSSWFRYRIVCRHTRPMYVDLSTWPTIGVRDLQRNPGRILDEVKRSGRPAFITATGSPLAEDRS